MLVPLGLTDIRCETYLTSVERIARRTGLLRLCKGLLVDAITDLTGNRLGWFHTVAARKL
jgi:hypothetical protein